MNGVERRSEHRLMTNLAAEVSLLGTEEAGAFPGTILNVSGRGLLLRIPRQTSCGAVLRIETGDTLLLGEVLRCEPSGDQWRVAVQTRHRLDGLTEIERLNRALLEHEAAPRGAV